MVQLDGYSGIFKSHENSARGVDLTSIYPEFKLHPEFFNFIISYGNGKFHSDSESLQDAFGINPAVASKFINKHGSKSGGDFSVIDVVESRHILMLTFLKHYMGDKSLGRVLEIGGGYGNFVRLATDILDWDMWCILDLEFVSKLQNWFLTNEKVPLNKVEFMCADKLYPVSPETVIGTHSLSEFDSKTFTDYYTQYIIKSNRFFYVSHVSLPSPELLQYKMKMILHDFKIVASKTYEGKQSIMYIFEKLTKETEI